MNEYSLAKVQVINTIHLKLDNMAEWTKEEIQEIWEKATPCPPNDPNVWRKDQCGAWINRDMYGAASRGEAHTSYKWQIDHKKHDSKGGADVVSNARPLQWYNNDYRQNGRLIKKITANGTVNIELDT